MADTKLTALTVATTLTDDDLMYCVDDPAGTPVSKAAAMSTLRSYVGGIYRSSLIDGLTLANNVTDANNDIDIAIGVATVTDGSNWFVATLASALIKRLDATWVVGTNQGGLDTGAEANSTWYHVWLIQRSDTAVVDVLFSLSATAPTMPANYDRKRVIGSIYNNASGNIDAFTQHDDVFMWAACKLITRANNPGTSAVNRTIQTPLGRKVNAIINVGLYGAAATSTTLRVSSPDQTDEAPTPGNAHLTYVTVLAGRMSAHAGLFRTNTSSQVRTRVSASSASVDLDMGCDGWVDPRGRNA